MSTETTPEATPEVEDAIHHVQKTLQLIASLKEQSSIRMLTHADGGKYLLLENSNILRAQKAFYLSRTGMLLVNGYDEQGDLYLDGMACSILRAELPINARDALVSRGSLSVSDVTLATYGKGTADPYTIDCQIIDPDTFVKELKFFPESYTSEGFKFGVELSDGTQGEILVELTGDSKYLTFDEIESFSLTHETRSTKESTPIFQILYEQSSITLGGFKVILNDEHFFYLASENSITVRLE